MFKKIMIVLVIFVALFVGVGFFLPGEWMVERTVTINAPAESIYLYVGNLSKWSEWTVWNTTAYPAMESTYSGPEDALLLDAPNPGDHPGHATTVCRRRRPHQPGKMLAQV